MKSWWFSANDVDRIIKVLMQLKCTIKILPLQFLYKIKISLSSSLNLKIWGSAITFHWIREGSKLQSGTCIRTKFSIIIDSSGSLITNQ